MSSQHLSLPRCTRRISLGWRCNCAFSYRHQCTPGLQYVAVCQANMLYAIAHCFSSTCPFFAFGAPSTWSVRTCCWYDNEHFDPCVAHADIACYSLQPLSPALSYARIPCLVSLLKQSLVVSVVYLTSCYIQTFTTMHRCLLFVLICVGHAFAASYLCNRDYACARFSLITALPKQASIANVNN